MASSSTNVSSAPDTRSADLRGTADRVFRYLEVLAKLSPRYRAILRYNAMSDADLAAQGMTREDVVHRVFGSRMGI